MIETRSTFPCFGGTCTVAVLADGDRREAVGLQRARLLAWHEQFTTFTQTSELSRLNADAREVVPASHAMRTFVTAAVDAHVFSGGLVDATLAGIRRVRVDDATIRRPLGMTFDSGGIAKGLFADWAAASLEGHAVAVDCAGDMRVRGAARVVEVADPVSGEPLHAFAVADAGVATSGVTRRGRHIVDPFTGRPADTSILQVTAIAASAFEAEVRAKAALLSGSWDWLPHGGVVVREDGAVEVQPPARRFTATSPPSEGTCVTPRNRQAAGAASRSPMISTR